MERIELFDRYISGTLSQAEVADFTKRLESDAMFESDFNVYLLTVKGICQEAEQENIEFGTALKSMSKEQLKAIIGTPKKVSSRNKIFRERILWIGSIAAMFIVAIGIGWNFYNSSQKPLVRCCI